MMHEKEIRDKKIHEKISKTMKAIEINSIPKYKRELINGLENVASYPGSPTKTEVNENQGDSPDPKL